MFMNGFVEVIYFSDDRSPNPSFFSLLKLSSNSFDSRSKILFFDKFASAKNSPFMAIIFSA